MSFPLLTDLLRFVQIGPLVIQLGRKRRDDPAAVGGCEPESREQTRQVPRLGSRDSTGSELRHRTDNDFHGPAVRISCDTRRNNFGELVPQFFLLLRESLRWTAESLRHDRFSCSGVLSILVISERATAFQNSGWCAI